RIRSLRRRSIRLRGPRAVVVLRRRALRGIVGRGRGIAICRLRVIALWCVIRLLRSVIRRRRVVALRRVILLLWRVVLLLWRVVLLLRRHVALGRVIRLLRRVVGRTGHGVAECDEGCSNDGCRGPPHRADSRERPPHAAAPVTATAIRIR